MRRRQFLSFTAAALASLAPTAFAQGSNLPRIGWMWAGRSTNNPNEVKGFRQGLRDLGYVEGQNIIVEYRWGKGSTDHLNDLAAELVRLRVDVIVVIGGVSLHALLSTGTTIPIVALTTDLVADGFVPSMPHPGGTITGISFMPGAAGANLSGKRLQLLKEAIPTITQVGILYTKFADTAEISEINRVAPTFGLVLHSLSVAVTEDIKPAISRLKDDGVEAIVVTTAPPLITHQQETVDIALELKLPTVSEQPEFAEDGGLLSYGPSIFTAAQRQAWYVDKILKGAKPGDLPVEHPSKFELVINLKTAKRLGIKVPELLLVKADRVIE
jgi:putative ABC transport system substrate-binding protein